jgi:hypothetical protein
MRVLFVRPLADGTDLLFLDTRKKQHEALSDLRSPNVMSEMPIVSMRLGQQGRYKEKLIKGAAVAGLTRGGPG